MRNIIFPFHIRTDTSETKLDRIAKNYFTLVEMLVVVAIISILAAILFPALRKAKMTASNIACLNRQKQTGVALYMYTGDNNGWIPASQIPYPTSGTISALWYAFIAPDYRTANVNLTWPQMPDETKKDSWFVCPNWGITGQDSSDPGKEGPGYSYGLNEQLASGLPKNVSTVKSPSKTALVLESKWFTAHSFHYNPLNCHGGPFYAGPFFRHEGGGNQLFVDGHVKHMKRKDVPDYNLLNGHTLQERDIFWQGK